MNLFQPQSPDQANMNNSSLEIPQFSISNLFSLAFNNLQTRLSNIINLRMPNPFKKNLALSAAEIKKRMVGIPVYKMSNHSEDRYGLPSGTNGERCVELFFLNKSDAESLAQSYMQQFPGRFDLHTLHLPLSEVVDYEGIGYPIRLVPELSQVKNAVEERKKDSTDFFPDDVRFPGVPVFQTDNLWFKDSEMPGKEYHPVFLRKEDLERTLAKYEAPDRSDIQVAALEDIIQSMKDDSTSKWNDVVFIAPGLTLSTWFRWRHKLF